MNEVAEKDEQKENQETKRAANQGTSPEKKRPKTVSPSEIDRYEMLDPGGTGDCAFRSASVAYALQSSRPIDEAVAKSKQLGATLRPQVASHLAKHHHFKEGFCVDDKWTIATEGGPVPKNYEEYLKACSRSGRWVDGPGLVTISPWLSRNLLIWKWNEDQKRYIKTALIEPHEDHPNATQHARAYPPLPLLLKQCHYMTLKPDANNPFPMTWNILPPNAHFDVRLHRGGRKSIQSWLSESSVGSWLPPSSSKQKSVRAAS